MSSVEIFFLSVALGADLFSVAVPIGMNRIRHRFVIRAAAVFALFHVAMIMGGHYLGVWLCRMVEHLGTDHFNCPTTVVENIAQGLGALVLAALGFEMILDFFRDETEVLGSQILEGKALLIVAASVSIDALAAGFSLGMLEVDLWQLSLILGGVIFVIGLAGLGLGRSIARYLDGKAEVIGGSVLLLLAVHLFHASFN